MPRFGWVVGLACAQALFVLEPLLQLLLVERLQLLVDLSAVVKPLAYRVVQSPGDIQQGPLAAVVDRQIQGRMQLTPLAATGGFAAGARPLDEGTAQEGLLGDQLGKLGTGVAFWGRALGSLAHGVSSPA
jgi:hypothetical protein